MPGTAGSCPSAGCSPRSVSDPLPGRVCVAAEDQLSYRSVYLQELRSVGMAPESGMDYQARGDLESSVYDFGLAGEDLAFDFCERLRGISADRAPSAGLLRRTDLCVSERIDRIHRADVPVVERDGVVNEEVD